MGRKRIYEEGYNNAKKATGPRSLVTAGRSMKNVTFDTPSPIDLRKLPSLIGKHIKIDIGMGNDIELRKQITICKLYRHMAKGFYYLGPEDGPKTLMHTGIGVADLIADGLIRFTYGKAEVNMLHD